jgi:hypothetical protein
MSKKIASSLFNRWLIILLFIFAIFMVFHNSFNYLDPDFGWHYQVGQEIWQNRQVPKIEHHLFPIAGQSWVDHEWLSNLTVYVLFELGGYFLVSLLFVGLVILAWYLLAKQTIKYWLDNQASSLFFWLILFIGLRACLPHFGIRIQEVTVLFLLILNIWLHRVVRQRYWPIWQIWVIPILFWWWASLHGGFLIGLVALLAWIVFRLIIYYWARYRQIKRQINVLPMKVIGRSILTAVLSIIATCLTPYGLKLYDFLSDYYSNNAYLWIIEEWLPITRAVWSWRMLYMLVFGLVIVLLIFHWRARQNKADRQVINWLINQDWWVLLFSSILFVAAWRSLRHFPLFFIISFPWVAGFFWQSWQDRCFNPAHWSIYLKILIVSVLLLSTISMAIATQWSNRPVEDYCHSYPCAAINYLKQSPYKNWPTMVDYGWGGFWYWYWPDKPIFSDGRLPQYSWRNRSLIEHYGRFFNESDIKNALADYDLSVVAIAQPRPVSYNWLESWLFGWGQKVNDYDSFSETMRRAMLKMPAWQLVYSDATAMIYVQQ